MNATNETVKENKRNKIGKDNMLLNTLYAYVSINKDDCRLLFNGCLLYYFISFQFIHLLKTYFRFEPNYNSQTLSPLNFP